MLRFDGRYMSPLFSCKKRADVSGTFFLASLRDASSFTNHLRSVSPNILLHIHTLPNSDVRIQHSYNLESSNIDVKLVVLELPNFICLFPLTTPRTGRTVENAVRHINLGVNYT
jgi:hypothetical protein